MSNLTDFFPAAGGGGGGILNVQTFTTSGSFDPAAAGLEVGDKIIVEAVAGGGGGATNNTGSYPILRGGAGGHWKAETFVLTATSSISIVIGSGGLTGTSTGSNGGTTTVSNSGVSVSCTGGAGGAATGAGNELINGSFGPHWPANAGSYNNGSPLSASPAGPGVNGYGAGGAVFNSQIAGISAGGTWGGGDTNYGGGGRTGSASAGRQGVVKIYY